jgi:hypothetical protein
MICRFGRSIGSKQLGGSESWRRLKIYHGVTTHSATMPKGFRPAYLTTAHYWKTFCDIANRAPDYQSPHIPDSPLTRKILSFDRSMSAMIASSIASFCLVFIVETALYLRNTFGKNDFPQLS